MAAAAAGVREVRLFPRQRRFVLDPARFPGYVGGIGSGKTFAGAAKVLARLGRREIGLVAAPTYDLLRDATQRTLTGLLDDLGVAYVYRKTDRSLTVIATGHEVIFRSLDDPEKRRGPNLDWAWVDEASLVTREAWNIVIGRVRTGAHPQVWATFTPKGRNWCWEVWERDADPDHPLYRVRTEENPELPPGFAQSLGYAGAFADQELGGEFVAFEGLVYPGFSRERHVRAVDCAGWEGTIGVDAGVRNPTAVLTVRHAGDARHVERELYRRGMGNDAMKAAVREEADRLGPLLSSIEIDPSAAGLIADLAIEGYPVNKADNNVVDGIRDVTTTLADGMTVDPSCANTISEFEGYAYPDGGRAEADRPVKQGDHAMDALRYAVRRLAAPAPQVYLY